MSALLEAAAEYLAVRRAVGFELAGVDKPLAEFCAHVESNGGRVTVELAMAWAGASTTSSQVARRLSMVRLFARFLQASRPETEVPPAGLVPFRSRRKVPHLFSDEEVEAMMAAARPLEPRLRATTIETVIGLLAVTGMRVGEVLALDYSDVSFVDEAITVRVPKLGRERLVPVSDSTLEAISSYLECRRELCSRPESPALFVTAPGRRLSYAAFSKTFHGLMEAVGIEQGARIHDLRHSFAVATLLGWYRAGADVQARLPRLSTYLGHLGPSATYWYLTGSPELMGLVVERLEEEGEQP